MSKPLRVLIVEDSEDDTALLLRELQNGGYAPTVERVDTPEAMSAALDQQKWELVLADWSMPRFSGLTALDLVKHKGLDLPFIIVSGTIGEAGGRRAGWTRSRSEDPPVHEDHQDHADRQQRCERPGCDAAPPAPVRSTCHDRASA